MLSTAPATPQCSATITVTPTIVTAVPLNRPPGMSTVRDTCDASQAPAIMPRASLPCALRSHQDTGSFLPHPMPTCFNSDNEGEGGCSPPQDSTNASSQSAQSKFLRQLRLETKEKLGLEAILVRPTVSNTRNTT